ncbi:MAG: pirin-like C-terminal cupin domain-containing protein [Bacteroidota bacterium]
MTTSPILRIMPLGFPWQTQDPFLFCVYHADDYPEGNAEMGPNASLAGRNLGQDFTLRDGWRMYHGETVPGFPAHPHRGFETITIVQKGLVDHSDSLGATARFGHGDVQWITTGKGLQHSEMFPLLKQDEPNPLVLFQIWLNLPRAGKAATPYFKILWADTIPTLEREDQNGKTISIDIIAGELEGTAAPAPTPDSWAADPANELAIFAIRLEAGAQLTLPTASKEANRSLYLYEGDQVEIAGQTIAINQGAALDASQKVTIQNGPTDAKLLFLQGRPIGEPVAQHGPFVMNTQAEIYEAFQDFQRTQFGGWPYDSHAPVHAREKGRFAQFPDGRVEEPSALSSSENNG